MVSKLNAFVDKEKCVGCGTCVAVCPVGAISMQPDHKAYCNQTCITCSACVAVCPHKAITIKNCEFKDSK